MRLPSLPTSHSHNLQSPSLQSSLLTALTSGTHLVVTGVNGEGVCGDDVLVGVLQCRQKLQQASKSCKMKVSSLTEMK